MNTFEIMAKANRKQVQFSTFMEDNGYKTITTFYMDFSFCDMIVNKTEAIFAIKDTYKRAFKEWRNNVEYITEFVMVLNHKIWEWYDKDAEFAKIYNDLWEDADAWCMDNLKGDELHYYCRTLD